MTAGAQPVRVRAHATELRFPASTRWIGRCRRWAADTAVRTGASESAASVVELLTSEVVTNAVRHGPPDGEVRVRVRAKDGVVGVEVDDEEPVPPVVRDVPPQATGGRGVRLVDDLATRWGVTARAGGKCVWFVVDSTRDDDTALLAG